MLLLPLSWAYCAIVLLRNKLYEWGIARVARVRVPVISVGNLTAGGTGKTPFVEYLVRYLTGKGKNVAVVSRGYKRTTSGMVAVGAGERSRSDARKLGDEPYQMARKFPGITVIVNKKRTNAAHVAVDMYGAEVIVLDDGFQHRSLGRDLDIVMIDATVPLEKTPCLPAGARREPLAGLGRAHVHAFTRLNAASPAPPAPAMQGRRKASCINVQFIQKQFQPMHGAGNPLPVSAVANKSCVAFCGIGTPSSFREMLECDQLRIADFLVFPDHHTYSLADLEYIRKAYLYRRADLILTTEKDAVRLLPILDAKFFPAHALCFLEIEARVTDGEQMLHRMIDNVFAHGGAR